MDHQGDPALPLTTLLLLSATIFAAITTEMLPVGLLTVMSRDLGITEDSVGRLVSAYAVVVAVMSLPMARLASRVSRQSALMVLLIGYATSNIIVALTDSYGLLLAARMLAGLAHAGFFPVAIAFAVESVRRHQTGRAVALVNLGNVLALCFGVPVGTALGTAIGWRWSFAIAGVVIVILTVAIRLFAPNPGQGEDVRPIRVPLATLIKGRAIWLVTAAVLVFMLGQYTTYTYISPILQGAGVPETGVSMVLFGYGAAGVIGLMLAAWLADRRLNTLLASAMVAAMISVAMVTVFTGSTGATVAAVVLWGAAFGVMPSSLQALAIRAFPDDSSLASAMISSAWNIGISGGAALGGSLFLISQDAMTLTTIGLMAIGLSITAAVGVMLLRAPRTTLNSALDHSP